MRNVLKLAKLEQAKKYTLFISEEWKYELFNFLAKELKVTRNVGEVMKRVLGLEQLKMKGHEISKLVPILIKDPAKLPDFVTSQEEEMKIITEAKKFLEKEFNCEIKIVAAEESVENKAKSAVPGKVGILVE